MRASAKDKNHECSPPHHDKRRQSEFPPLHLEAVNECSESLAQEAVTVEVIGELP
jgi:hypothetical protein